MIWTVDSYAIGKKGVYRVVYRGVTRHVQLLRPKSGYWEDVLHNIKPEGGRFQMIDDFDEAPNGWESV